MTAVQRTMNAMMEDEVQRQRLRIISLFDPRNYRPIDGEQEEYEEVDLTHPKKTPDSPEDQKKREEFVKLVREYDEAWATTTSSPC